MGLGLGLGECRPGFARTFILKVILFPVKWERTRRVPRGASSNLVSFRLGFANLSTGIIGAMLLLFLIFLRMDTWPRRTR